MTTYNFPDVKPDSANFGLSYNVQLFQSELTNDVNQRALAGDRWIASLVFTNRVRANGATKLRTFLNRQRGGLNRFRMSPPDLDQQGTLAGTPVVNGAGQTGTTLIVSGFSPSQTVLAEGDYFEVNGELKQLAADAVTDVGGNVTLDFEPPLRTASANAAPIEVVAPKATFMLTNPEAAVMQANAPIIYAVTIEAMEDVNA